MPQDTVKIFDTINYIYYDTVQIVEAIHVNIPNEDVGFGYWSEAIALFALLSASYFAHQNRKHNRLSTRPIISLVTFKDCNIFDLVLHNNGHGSAIVTSITYYYHDNKYDNVSLAIDAFFNDSKFSDNIIDGQQSIELSNITKDEPLIMESGGKMPLANLKYIRQISDKELFALQQNIYQYLSIKVEYKSIYEKKTSQNFKLN